MMEGTAARSCTAVSITRASAGGAISTSQKATPKAKGTANTSATTVVISVPKIDVAAPKLCEMGFHALLVMNPGPKVEKACHPPLTSTMMMPAMTSRMDHPASRASMPKAISPALPPALRPETSAPGLRWWMALPSCSS